MITLITGKPGDGKTLYACREIIRILRNTDYYVVTDVPFVMGRLHEYVNDWKGDVVDLDERLKVLTPEDAHNYWRYRSGGLLLDESPDAKGKDDGTRRLPKMEFDLWARSQFERIGEKSEYQRGVFYVIDEAHEKFPAREWQNIGRITTYHASKHRHLHDEVWLLTQSPDFLDKTLRNLVSETRITRNNLRRNVGPFKLRGVFKVRHYYGMPNPSVTPFSVEEMQLDAAGIASCYKTVGAFGVHVKAEKIQNKGKLPWWSLWAIAGGGILAAIFLCFMVPQWAIAGLGKSISDAGQPLTQTVQDKTASQTEQSLAYMRGPLAGAGQSQGAEPGAVEAAKPEKIVRGCIVLDGETLVSGSWFEGWRKVTWGSKGALVGTDVVPLSVLTSAGVYPPRPTKK
ncbi:hypothetical protein H5P28_07045 [Ruficoccus amylovorans]|uniref:Zona occludens toxin N-terminal domain-containing protein n=1 Tax=Ruficoccus amylovorans TaxID=1804625 RepID=A0A842HC19_9BACT|nr:zonular occludens toxin domain-containing protein [Ruficoccus amylovorans]MBC2594015.1 hypothetical protein [Ruficoccus amylovorans]